MSAARGVRGRLWLEDRFQPGWLAWERGRISAVGLGDPPRARAGALLDLGRARVLPGFVDTLVHGFGGHDAGTAGAAELQEMAAGLARAGVTSAWCGLYPLEPRELRRAARDWSAFCKRRGGAPRARLLGWHLEGPFVPRAMRGALPAAGLRRPGAPAARALLAACGGWLRACTLAPELPGALAAAAVLREHRVQLWIGHTRARHADCLALAEQGPVGMTHLGNRMPPLTARAPGPIGFALAGRARWVGAIPDGVHLAPATLAMLAAQPLLRAKLLYTSDNLSHAGLPAADFRAGGQRLQRDGAVARNARGSLAGTLDPLPALLLGLVRSKTLTWAQAVHGGCEVPGALVGGCGRLQKGLRADLVVLDASGQVRRSWVGGREVPR